MSDKVSDAASPVRMIPSDSGERPLAGLGLCLSGGGYRAMVFHLGVLWRLNETGQLTELDRVSSVSGGSITAGVLAKNWAHLEFRNGVAQNFVDLCVEPVRRMASTDIDIAAVALGMLIPGVSISNRVAKAYRRILFGKATLQDLPDSPRFVFNATNLESGALLRFSKPYLADYRVGKIDSPDLWIATAVAASSAFPPFLSPATLDLEDEEWVTEPGNDLATPDFRGEIQLSDGGVYDNLGLETVWKKCKTILVSDGGGHMAADATPPTDWARQLRRVLDVEDNQVRALRKRQVVGAFQSGDRTGMYVGIRSHISDFPTSVLSADPVTVTRLAATPTRLDAMDPALQEQLINWGYVVCDAGLRSFHLADDLRGAPATGLPYPHRTLT
ncbi:putative esterase of the alpha-beta hydrolase superfamily [Mycolicibacterium chubuense NBB4]|uniref:Putative esterase of the alpha-beta hydrolase superfamily n=1 Tax=Mycolicibacterium chubuense (strain NBB4) TaxID=710421 RepID=I4BKB3_MYCCN|nr:patatin-like phospholipase family protein [Mycolicibacterium chubuense]AFM17720.1 putative esterase of the alpha-beta hydrolase superfamily [Mycolicibacterium chubuense NBB4]